LKNKEGNYSIDVSEEHHEKGRSNHTKRDEAKNETLKANYNTSVSSGNGWLPPELDFSNDYKAAKGDANTRAKNKAKEAIESENEDKKEDKKEDSEEKEESKESEDSDNKDT